MEAKGDLPAGADGAAGIDQNRLKYTKRDRISPESGNGRVDGVPVLRNGGSSLR
jgi:hypothetical protein